MRGIGVFSIILLTPWMAHASVIFTEIMYAPDGADATHEWVEVCNTGADTVDIGAWKFFEADTNHGLTLVRGASTLATHECAVIADNANVFGGDYPSYTDALFDSAFSLHNSGETLVLKDSGGVIVDTLTYTSSSGADNDGQTLHRSNGVLTAAAPTPGVYAQDDTSVSDTTDTTTTSPGGTTTHTALYSYESVTIQPPEDVFLRVPKRIETTVGAHTRFEAESYDATGARVREGIVNWSFGDGGSAVGWDVSHQFYYEGTYTTVVRIERNGLTDEQVIDVVVAPLDVTLVFDTEGAWVALHNKSTLPLALDGWRLVSGGQYFVFPQETYIAPDTTVRFAKEITGLTFLRGTQRVSLMYPDGAFAHEGVREDGVVTMITDTQSEHPDEPVVKEESGSVADSVRLRTRTPDTEQRIIGFVPMIASESRVALPDQQPEHDDVYVSATSAPQTALALAAPRSNTSFFWYGALALLIVAGLAGVVIVRSRPLIVRGFEVIEDES